MKSSVDNLIPHFEVQQYHGKINVVRQNGILPRPQRRQVRVKMLACGICGTDIRAVQGNKHSSGQAHNHITSGHEGVGRVVAVGSGVTGLKKGDIVVILPHVLPSFGQHVHTIAASQIDPVHIGHYDTLHMGWDTDGCFADYITVSADNLAYISPSYVKQVRMLAPKLGEALFALVEPMLCTLTAYIQIEEQLYTFARRRLTLGRALVIGCGPIGMLHILILLKRGFKVWVMDSQQKRARLARWLFNDQVYVFDPAERPAEKFKLVMVSASSAEAIKTGEIHVDDKGILYLFAGLNTAEREVKDQERVISYEELHRNARGILTNMRLVNEEKSVLYIGHSGYYQVHAEQAIAAVAANATLLERMVTGIIRGWTSPCIEACLPGGTDWKTEDGSPAIVQVLNGLDLRDQHAKLIVLLEEVIRREAMQNLRVPERK